MKHVSRWDQFKLLLWKNYKLQIRRIVATIFELGLPLTFTCLLIYLRALIPFADTDEITSWRSFHVDQLPLFLPNVLPSSTNRSLLVGYAPKNSYTDEIMQKAQDRLNIVPRSPAVIEQICQYNRESIINEALPNDDPKITKLKECLGENLFFALSYPKGRTTGRRNKEYDSLDTKLTEWYDIDPSKIENVLNLFGVVPQVTVQGFDSEASFNDYVRSDDIKRYTLAGAIFDSVEDKNDIQIRYRFRDVPFNVDPASQSNTFRRITRTWMNNQLFPTVMIPGPREGRSYDGGSPRYYQEGFLSLMHAVNMAIADHSSNKTNTDSFQLKRFPYPPFRRDIFLTFAVQRTLPLLLTLSFLFTALVITRSVVLEKETRMKEYMLMMGLSKWVLWLSWYVKCVLFTSISILVMCALYKIPVAVKDTGLYEKVLPYSDISCIILFLIMFTSAMTTLSFALSTLFQKAHIAAPATGVIYFLSYFPVLLGTFEETSDAMKLLGCLVPNIALGLGCELIGNFEGQETGIQWSTLNRGITVDSNFTFSKVIIMLLVDTVLYMLITFYVENVYPGQYGIPKPWYYFCDPSYWKGVSIEKDIQETDDDSPDKLVIPLENPHFEAEPTDLDKVVEIANLRKVFTTHGLAMKVAVDNLNLNMYKNQITVLLGHNGAGKTTTMSMLTGFLPPTSGDAVVNGCSIRTNIEGVRESMGLCPQFNILFDSLTCQEHMYFFGKLKGLSSKEANDECDEMLTDLQLMDKKFVDSSSLSGGMKRKLSVGIALAAGSQYVILDEPTSGMDPSARRALWDVLKKYKSRCSILLSTHFMDEADILGDRIAIMADGKMRCSGSSPFLKNQFGVGYHIVLTKTPQCNIDQLTKMFKEHVSEANLKRIAGAEVSYLLPFTTTAKFPKLFEELECSHEKLGITSYGATITTMEEVFLRVTEDAEDDMKNVVSKLSVAQSGTSFLQKKEGTTNDVSKLSVAQSGTSFLQQKEGTTKDVSKLSVAQSGTSFAQQQEGTTNDVSKLSVAPSSGPSFLHQQEGTTKDEIRQIPSKTPSKLAQLSSGENTGFKLWRQQFYALIVKKLIHSKRNYKVSITQLLLPVLCALLAVLNASSPTLEPPSHRRSLTLESYGDNKVLYNSSAGDASDFAAKYSGMFDGVISPEKRSESLGDYIAEQRKDPTFTSSHLISATFDQGKVKNKTCNMMAQMSCKAANVTEENCGNSSLIESLSVSLVKTCLENCGICQEKIIDPDGRLESIAWFNNHAYHTVATTLLYLDQAYVRYVGNGSKDNFKVDVVNHPLPKNSSNKLAEELFLGSQGGFSIASSCILGFSFLSATFVIFLIRERVDRSRLLQTLAGVDPLCFWTSTFVWDFINIITPCLLSMICFLGIKEFTENAEAVFVLFVSYCWCSLALTYCLSFLWDIPSAGFVRVFLFNYLTGLVGLIGGFVITAAGSGIEKEWQGIFSLFPSYALGQGLSDIYLNAQFKEACLKDAETEEMCETLNYTYQNSSLAWDSYGAGKYVTYPFIEGFILFALLFANEYHLFKAVGKAFGGLAKTESMLVLKTNEDSDVTNEKDRISTTAIDQLQQTDCLIVKNITKVYKKKVSMSIQSSHLAVDDLSFGIPSGECFGLLGINGAGKTTTFKMLTGDYAPTSGTFYLDGFEMKTDMRKVQQRIGYCPQFDALIDQMTGRETLTMFARLRGVAEEKIEGSIEELSRILYFAQHFGKPCGTYSGGNKRKLSTAIALIGGPSIVLLDEPSTGMDPAAKRKLWDALSDVRASGRAIVITSHSMEECEALCTRLAIMVNGKFRCIGGSQHLKTKFGQGYNLEIKIAYNPQQEGGGEPPMDVMNFINSQFPGSVYKGFIQNILNYHLPSVLENGQTLKLAQIFEIMEQGRGSVRMEEYTVAQSSLEQVFLNLVQWQKEVED